jgi:hypothetical protein
MSNSFGLGQLFVLEVIVDFVSCLNLFALWLAQSSWGVSKQTRRLQGVETGAVPQQTLDEDLNFSVWTFPFPTTSRSWASPFGRLIYFFMRKVLDQT